MPNGVVVVAMVAATAVNGGLAIVLQSLLQLRVNLLQTTTLLSTMVLGVITPPGAMQYHRFER